MKNIFILLLPAVLGELKAPGFTNPIYSAFNYTGSRILETNYTANKYSDSYWFQTATLDGDNNIFLADTNRHAIIRIPASTQYRAFPSEGYVLSGTVGRAGHRDGSLDIALFNGPKGIAYVEVGTKEYLYVADTGNHCVRRIDLKDKQVVTIAGIPGSSGHRDGDGRKAEFNAPSSVGVDSPLGLVFIHDAGSLVRMVSVTTPDVFVSTLVSGACRGIDEMSFFETIVRRSVRCQTEWTASSPGSTEAVDEWQWPSFCLGNSVTCATRYSDEL